MWEFKRACRPPGSCFSRVPGNKKAVRGRLTPPESTGNTCPNLATCGLFYLFAYDQADNRLRGRPLLNSGTVIDAFCYAGGWGVSAALAGAARVLCVDSSESALAYARRNAERNGVVGRMAFLRGDVADVLRGFTGKETPGAIVLDPPAFVKRKKDLDAGTVAYQRLNELALALMPDGGFLISCSCSQHVDRDDFLRLLQKASRRAGSELRLLFEGGQSADHPVHPAMPETRYLKALFLQVDGTDAAPGRTGSQ